MSDQQMRVEGYIDYAPCEQPIYLNSPEPPHRRETVQEYLADQLAKAATTLTVSLWGASDADLAFATFEQAGYRPLHVHSETETRGRMAEKVLRYTVTFTKRDEK